VLGALSQDDGVPDMRLRLLSRAAVHRALWESAGEMQDHTASHVLVLRHGGTATPARTAGCRRRRSRARHSESRCSSWCDADTSGWRRGPAGGAVPQVEAGGADSAASRPRSGGQGGSWCSASWELGSLGAVLDDQLGASALNGLPILAGGVGIFAGVSADGLARVPTDEGTPEWSGYPAA
jgi:hypothetical protein